MSAFLARIVSLINRDRSFQTSLAGRLLRILKTLSSVPAVDVILVPAFGASVDMIASSCISFGVGVLASETGSRVEFGITQSLAAHCLPATIAALAMRLAFIPAVGLFFFSKFNQARAFTAGANPVPLRNRIPGSIDCWISHVDTGVLILCVCVEILLESIHTQ